MKKRILSMMICALMCVSVTACGNDSDNSSASASAAPKPTAQQEKPVTQEPEKKEEEPVSEPSSVTETPSVTETVTEAPTPEPVEVDTVGFYSSSEDVIRDIIKEYDGNPRVFLFDASETFEEYQIFFSEGTGIIRLIDVCCFYKDVYTMDYLESMDMDSFYPGISELSFAEVDLVEAGDFYVMGVMFNNLDNPDNVKAMNERGIITMLGDDPKEINAESYAMLMKNNGKIELDPETMLPVD